MIILHDFLEKRKNEFAHSRKGGERGNLVYIHHRCDHRSVHLFENFKSTSMP